VNLSLGDIESSWAGLRPLIHEEGKSASELSRKDEIFESGSGLISIAGGKLTGYRKMAERVVNLVIKKHFDDRNFKPCRTAQIKLAASAFSSVKDVKKFVQSISAKLGTAGIPIIIGTAAASHLVENFGMQGDEILRRVGTFDSSQPELALLKAQLSFCIQHEMVCNLQDFFVRRTGLIYFDIHQVEKWKQEIAKECATILGWDNSKTSLELTQLEALISSQRNFS
jgi:glycerol-3-phosphate dehydrogenase